MKTVKVLTNFETFLFAKLQRESFPKFLMK